MGSLVVLAPGAALNVLFLGQEALQLGVDLDDRSFLVDGRGRRSFRGGRGGRGGWRRAGLAEIGPAPSATGRDDPAGPVLAGRLADGHGRLAVDLVLGRNLVRQDVALVDPDLDPDAAVGGLGLTEAVVDVGAQGVQRDPTFPVELPARTLR